MRNLIKQLVTIYRLPILAGFLIGTSYIPFPPWALLFCLVPLFVFWTRSTRSDIGAKKAFIGGWLTQFILSLIGFHWIAYTAVEFGHFPLWGGALALLGFCVIAHLHYAIAGPIGYWLTQKFQLGTGATVFTFATVFAIVEHRYPMIFPWHLGYPWLWAGFPGAQITDVIGFEGLNIATIYINALLAWGFIEWREKASSKRVATLAGAGLTLFAVLNLLGIGRAEPWTQTDAELKVLAVQGNIGNFDKIMAERGRSFREPIVQKYIELTQKGFLENPSADLVIWPETAFPDVLDAPFINESNARLLRNFVQASKVPLLTGSYSYDRESKDTFNGFFYIDAQGNLPIAPYRKSILLVFGETFPFSEYLPYMDTLFPDLGSFGRGLGPTTMPVTAGGAEIRLGPQICYEGLYPWFTASLTKQGAQILTNVTNDSWFGKPFEPQQHLYMTLARAVEFRRPLIRSTNTGITTVALASGEILNQSPLHDEWTGLFRVPYMSEPSETIYQKIAGRWVWALVFGLVLLVVFGRGRKQKRTHSP